MSIIQEISARPGYLHVEVTGRFSLEEAKGKFVEMMEAVARDGAVKVLFDGRGLVGSPDVMERFEYGRFAAETVAKLEARGVAFAYLLKTPMRDPERLSETVAQNRGMDMAIFGKLDDALAWLGVTSAKNPLAAGFLNR